MTARIGRKRRTEAGFTLIEMLVSVTLVAVMAVALWGALRLSIGMWKRGTEFIDSNQRHRVTMDLVEKQFASAFGMIAPLNLQEGGGLYPIFTGTTTGVRFISLSSLRFREDPGLTVVDYEVVPGADGDYALVEREDRYLGADPTLDAGSNPAERPGITVFEHLVSMTFEYFDPGTTEAPAQWVKEWDGKEMGRLPTAISLTMTSREANGGTRSRQIVMPFPARPADSGVTFNDPFDEQRRGGAYDPRIRR